MRGDGGHQGPVPLTPTVVEASGLLGDRCHAKQTSNADADVVPSAQVGVQQGNEVRIYQLGGGR